MPDFKQEEIDYFVIEIKNARKERRAISQEFRPYTGAKKITVFKPGVVAGEYAVDPVTNRLHRGYFDFFGSTCPKWTVAKLNQAHQEQVQRYVLERCVMDEEFFAALTSCKGRRGKKGQEAMNHVLRPILSQAFDMCQLGPFQAAATNRRIWDVAVLPYYAETYVELFNGM